jgi:phosphoenolpyruvate synthase/pyruvate phosphate dikinase
LTEAPGRPAIHLNLSVPELAAAAAELPAAGVGLMRAEFLALGVGTHPSALLAQGGEDAFLEVFRGGLETVAGAFHPRPVAYRTLDLKTNEYRGLAGGADHEPAEANPMIGLRGAARYVALPDKVPLEMRAVAQAVDGGLDNIRLVIPFVRTLEELATVKTLVAASGLPRRGVPLWMMAEVPSNVLMARRFAAEVDGVSIGSNDLTQLILGVDRDSPELTARYGAGEECVLEAIELIVAGAHAAGVPASICGDAPSRDGVLVQALVRMGIDSISVVPSAFEETSRAIEDAVRARA